MAQQVTSQSYGYGKGGEIPRFGYLRQEGSGDVTRPLATVVTDIWQHALLTRHTIEHREKGKRDFEQRLAKFGLNKDEYIGIPVGSAVWIVEKDGSSDHDMWIICRTERAKRQLYDTFPPIGGERDSSISHFIVTQDEVFDTIRDNRYNPLHPRLAPLFLTPDEHVGGNKDALARLRLRAIDAIKHTPGAHQYVWDGSGDQDSHLQRAFNEKYVMWGLRGLRYDDVGKRGRRIYAMLEARGRRIVESMHAQTHENFHEIMNTYRSWFFSVLGNLQLPSFAEVEKELRATGGKINLIPERAAHHDLQPGTPTRRCVWAGTYIELPGQQIH